MRLKAPLTRLIPALTLLACGTVSAQSLNQFENLAVQAMRQQQTRSDVSVNYRAADLDDLRLPESRRREEKSQRALEGQDRTIDPATYRLAPGDRILFSIWGEIDDSYDLLVTPEGFLLIPSVGPVQVAGSTLVAAQTSVEEASREAYRNSRTTLTLTELRTFRVHVTGLVAKPGTYEATPVDRVSDLITRAEGFGSGASSRRIILRLPGAAETTADMIRYLLAGDLEANPYVDMGAVVHVPARGDSVTVLGAVNNTGSIEFRPGDTVGDLVRLAGGTSADAVPDRLEWTTFPSDTATAATRTVSLSSSLASPVHPGDILTIPGRADWHRRASVVVQGEVHNPGGYSIVEGTTRVSDVLTRAGGLTGEASMNASRLVRRGSAVQDDEEYQRVYDGRTLSVNDPIEAAYGRQRTRQGAPGVPLALSSIVGSPGSLRDVLLSDGDTLLIERRQLSIELLGQVGAPGLYAYHEGATFGDYMREAGGYGWRANKPLTRIIRAGSGVWVKPNNDTVLEPGDVIFVPDREHTNWWQVAKDLVLLASQITGTIATIIILGR